ncbi:putative mitochondrial protein [Tanacetum coccineum]
MNEQDIHKIALEFLKDTMSSCKSLQDHVQHLDQVLEIMKTHSLFAKLSKCTFVTNNGEYLGHIIFDKGVSTDSRKIQAMLDWPIPQTIKQLRGFLGLTGYYRSYVVDTNVSFARLSKDICGRNRCFWEGLCLLMKMALDKWRGYLLDRHFKIKTDHFSLKYVLRQRLTTPFQNNWLSKLLGYDYEISYKKGSENIVADAFSRVSGGTELNSLILTTIASDLLQ